MNAAPCLASSLSPPLTCHPPAPHPTTGSMYPAVAFAIQALVSRLPWVLAESWVWTLMVRAQPACLPPAAPAPLCTASWARCSARPLLQPSLARRVLASHRLCLPPATPPGLFHGWILHQRPPAGLLGSSLRHRPLLADAVPGQRRRRAPRALHHGSPGTKEGWEGGVEGGGGRHCPAACGVQLRLLPAASPVPPAPPPIHL